MEEASEKAIYYKIPIAWQPIKGEATETGKDGRLQALGWKENGWRGETVLSETGEMSSNLY